MNRNERRNKSRQCEKELAWIERYTPYKSLQNTTQFNLPKEELDQLVAQTHEDKDLQADFDLAKKIFMRVDYLKQTIELMKDATNKVECPVRQGAQTPHPHSEP